MDETVIQKIMDEINPCNIIQRGDLYARHWRKMKRRQAVRIYKLCESHMERIDDLRSIQTKR